MKKTKSILVPPFPELSWDEFFWSGEIKLDAWSGFQTRLGPYASISSEEPSNGLVKLSISPADADKRTPPSAEQGYAFEYLIQYQKELRDLILYRFWEEYPTWISECEDADDFDSDPFDDEDEEERDYRGLQSPEDLRAMVGLHKIHILSTTFEDGAYYGFEFGCNWEEEHGLGVMFHWGRMISVGQADVSFTQWIAEEDAEQQKSG